MIFCSQPIPIRLLICCVFTLGITSAEANNNVPKTLFEALPPNLGEMQLSPNRIPTNQATLVTATLRIQYDYKPKTVILRRLDKNGQNAVATLAAFHDDGKQGDEIANDGVYTVQTRLTAKQPGNIMLDALATFINGAEQQQLASFVETVHAKAEVIANQAYVAIDGTRVIFRDKTGRTIREESDQTNNQLKTAALRNAQTKAEVTFKQHIAIASPDKSHVGIVGSLQSLPVTPSTGKDKITLAGWEFRYQDVSGSLWTKTIDNPERSFYFSGSSPLISEDGGRVLLIEVGEDNDNPILTVYDSSGSIVLQEKPALYAIEDAQISGNGRFILLKGLPLEPKQDFSKLIVITIDNPTQRWLETYHASKISSEEIRENVQGGFDIWFNDHKHYSFPK